MLLWGLLSLKSVGQAGDSWVGTDVAALGQNFFIFREISVFALKALQLIGQGPPALRRVVSFTQSRLILMLNSPTKYLLSHTYMSVRLSYRALQPSQADTSDGPSHHRAGGKGRGLVTRICESGGQGREAACQSLWKRGAFRQWPSRK